jgi:hypothetical protein
MSGPARRKRGGRNFDQYASIYVDGQGAAGSIEVTEDEQEQVLIERDELPEDGRHLIQVQAENGLFRGGFIFHVKREADAAAELKQSIGDTAGIQVDLDE